ncbi:hypothetical protein [Mycolicibacterium goodii]|uniref:hypothetical protein n=1 Tax=Mycolicibacterium goodii TaxID=134601 RepID=UPI001BDCD3C1|nr:hypothetical protein [Mycolicibacterium goodii]MBU8830807.1 hypothetical protein [Mycolicibacterium goodii]
MTNDQPPLPGFAPELAVDAERFLRELDQPLGHGLDLSTLPQIYRRLHQRYADQPDVLARVNEAAEILREAGKL